MVTFVLFLSMTLNILCLLFIALLYVRQNRFITVEKQQEKLLEEMEDVVSSFISEIKEENEIFLKKIEETNQAKKKSISEKKEDSRRISLQKNVPKTFNKKIQSYRTVQHYQKNAKLLTEEKENTDELLNLILPSKKEVKKEKSLLEKVVEMQEEGKKIEEIAKILNKGKTEIELLLKFRQKKE
jgi:putative lipase involved disintegration of autophagic bodies